MKTSILMLSSLIFIGCASTQELKAPCTYDDRTGCGELIYMHEQQISSHTS